MSGWNHCLGKCVPRDRHTCSRVTDATGIPVVCVTVSPGGPGKMCHSGTSSLVCCQSQCRRYTRATRVTPCICMGSKNISAWVRCNVRIPIVRLLWCTVDPIRVGCGPKASSYAQVGQAFIVVIRWCLLNTVMLYVTE